MHEASGNENFSKTVLLLPDLGQKPPGFSHVFLIFFAILLQQLSFFILNTLAHECCWQQQQRYKIKCEENYPGRNENGG